MTLTPSTLRPKQNGHHFAAENCCILGYVFMYIVPKGPIYNNPALVHIMASHQTGDKLLSQPIMAKFTDAYMRHLASMS